jgi:SAM-dependent methyltransferase
MRIAISDGRYFMSHCTNRYDAVLLDAFLGDSLPSHLMTREAFTEMRRALNPQGVLVINSFGDFNRGKDFFLSSIEKTLKSVFASVQVHHDRTAIGFHNVFFVASDRAELKAMRRFELDHVHPICRRGVEMAFRGTEETEPSHGRLLTDEYNPIEFYDAANREEFRQKVVGMASSL